MTAITFKQKPVSIEGEPLNVGDEAPDFNVLATDLSEVTLADYEGKVKLLSVVPSLDTSVCDSQTRRFNEEFNTMEDVKVLTLSMDLPFAQKRWCGSAGAQIVDPLSDHRDASFGRAYGVLMKEMRLLARAVFVVDTHDIIQYVEYVQEATSHPDYDSAVKAVQNLETP
ncbi:thiol peroxidase [Thalassobacillus sp. CUG 92003]|uniref:thiol peroxidase n=1 Tax=Thalassobacillus sp. CUG 92003 TaxID=2736641 RepID=UPI0015E63C83|nr:thiol peroxidase [Thalassobacillus sp. CUG 92003]